ncbi:hypothetical protein [Streptomyces sp. NPDC005231]|uniref:hypothetical protein n=1 Tax=Streptomyces sp. NPDC005231 TaxID=3157026 RepID=UPI0033B28668
MAGTCLTHGSGPWQCASAEVSYSRHGHIVSWRGSGTSKGEWFHKSRRLSTLEHRLDVARDDWKTGHARVVRGGRQLLKNRHNLQAAQLTEPEWRQRWETERCALEGGAAERIGIILCATVQGITTMINSDMIDPGLLDELVEIAVEQFLRGARPIA